MKFYTSVERYGNRILYRGYDGAERIQKRVPFKPTLFVEGKGDWSTLEGKQVAPLELDSMKDATDFIKRYENIDTVKIYGMNNMVHQFITYAFPNDVNFDPNQIVVSTIDIEVASDQGFPEPDVANHPVISICIKSSKEDYFRVWALGDYEPKDNEIYNCLLYTSPSPRD